MFINKMEEAVRYLSKRASFPTLLTVFSGFIVVVVKGELAALDVFYLVVVVCFQFYFQMHNKLYAKAVPIEWLTNENKLRSGVHYRRVNWFLSASPMLLIMSSILSWLALVVVFLTYGWGLVFLAKRLFRRKKILATQVQNLEELKPQVAVYVSGLANVAYQINQWLPVLEELDEKVVIIVRQRSIYRGMHSTRIPIIYAKKAMHVELVLEKGVRTVLYPANPMQNLHALRHFKLNHFFINHGESDKAVNQNKLLLAYDKLLVGGSLAHRRLLEAGLKLRRDQVEYVGRPQAEMALDQTDSLADNEIKTVLYAPTWEGFVEEVNYSSVYKFGLDVVESLVGGGFKVIFKPHPYTGSRSSVARQYLDAIKSFCEKHDVEVVDSMVSIHSCMNRSDLLVTDVSSVLNEYLVTRKPVILCVTERLSGVNVTAEFPSSRAAYHLEKPMEAGELVNLISKEDTLVKQREAVRKDSLGDFSEGALNQFKAIISESVNEKKYLLNEGEGIKMHKCINDFWRTS